MIRRTASLTLCLSLLGMCESPARSQGLPASTTPAAKRTEGDKLQALFRESDAAYLKRNPVAAIFRGDLRYADRFGDYCSDSYFAGERAAAERDLIVLRQIDRTKLTESDRVGYDVFQYQTSRTLAGFAPEVFAAQVVRPINHMDGVQVFYPVFSSGNGAAPFKTLADYENNLKRHREFPANIDCSIGRFREGLKTGILDTKLTVRNIIEQLELQLARKPEDSPYYGPVKSFPDDVAQTDRVRLREEYARIISTDLHPAYRRLRDFLATEYLPNARDGAGLVHMKNGRALYDFLIENSTTIKMDAAEIHDLGLNEVSRIRAGIEALRKQVGFNGGVPELFEHLRTDSQFHPPSADWLRDRYTAIGKQVDSRISEQFSILPKAKLEIRPVEPFREKTEAGGSYLVGTPDGSRPGVFYFNTCDLPSGNICGMETLYLHEGSPGHHFQISLAQENEALPAFMRFGGNTAFVEGWALYAETLGPELGLFKDPYQQFGHLNDEMLRAMRLVVDTGIHSKGWTRDQAIEFMLTNSGMSRTDATAEVERYIAIPGQALAYKIGALTIQRLKLRAQRELAARFDPRQFHATVLTTGALPLEVLERKVETWISQTRPK
jgi:uncharacterized protein (DUF885 family)